MTLPPTRFDFTAAVPAVGELGRVHLIAIGGAGMSAVARLMLAAGVAVSGSDARDSPLLSALVQEGASVHVGHDAAVVEGVDTVVVSSAIRDSNVELAAAHAAGLRVLHRAQALAATMAGSRRVAVAGANGKTTTTSLLTMALRADGSDPSFALGGELTALRTNAHLGAGDVFVVEADESDGSFLAYRPHVAVVTSVQPDHLDFYGDLATVREAYAAFVETVSSDGLVVVCVDDPGARALGEHARTLGLRVVGYGESADADLRVTDVHHDGLSSRATLSWDGTSYPLSLQVPGHHNVLNAAAAFGAAVIGVGEAAEAALAGLAAFAGTGRRFEPRGAAAGVTVVDDYAHNPGKLTAVVSTGRRLVDEAGSRGEPGRLVVVFQPHLYSRTRDFARELGAALAPADVVVVMDVYAAREDPVPGVSGRLVADAATAGCTVHYEPQWERVAPLVVALVEPGDLVLTVGAGDVTAIGPLVLEGLAGLVDPDQEETQR
ncbi:UDP-N-acetylmuramate--L-alanine ligase [Dermatophilaceae bacterium Soc4.6]